MKHFFVIILSIGFLFGICLAQEKLELKEQKDLIPSSSSFLPRIGVRDKLQQESRRESGKRAHWIAAFAGMTERSSIVVNFYLFMQKSVTFLIPNKAHSLISLLNH
jgi:hypothetical protein